MNDKQIQEMFDKLLNRNGMLGEYYTMFIADYGVNRAIEYANICEDLVYLVPFPHRDKHKWLALHEMWQKELREAGL